MNLHAIKTICSKIYHTFSTEGAQEIPASDLSLLIAYLNVPSTAVYCMEVDDDGFVFTTENASFRYHHDAKPEERLIDVV
jgi:hypothetical protein